MELFWDVVDVLDQKLDEKVAIVEDVIKRHNAKLTESKPDGKEQMDVTETPFAVTAESTWNQFFDIVNGEADASMKALSEEELQLVFKTVLCYNDWYMHND